MEAEEILAAMSEVEVRGRNYVTALARQSKKESERLHKSNLQLSRQIEGILTKGR